MATCVSEELKNEVQSTPDSVLPPRSKEKYIAAYENFVHWNSSANDQSFSEDVFLAYFKELSTKYKPSSMWCIYSMLKSTVRTNKGIDMNKYPYLIDFLKGQSDSFGNGKKVLALSRSHLEKFIKEAPDSQYLATKVALIFGINGACSRKELNRITTNDIEDNGLILKVSVTNAKTKVSRSFTVEGPYYDIVQKYKATRTKKAKHDRFFQNYQNGKCTRQPTGVNKFGCMPKEIAKYLGLPNADSYTGHSFRKTSAVMRKGSRRPKPLGGRQSKPIEETSSVDLTQNESSKENSDSEPQSNIIYEVDDTSSSDDMIHEINLEIKSFGFPDFYEDDEMIENEAIASVMIKEEIGLGLEPYTSEESQGAEESARTPSNTIGESNVANIGAETKGGIENVEPRSKRFCPDTCPML